MKLDNRSRIRLLPLTIMFMWRHLTFLCPFFSFIDKYQNKTLSYFLPKEFLLNKIRNCLSNRIQSHEISYSYTNKFQLNMIGVMLPVGEAVPKEILEGVTVMSLLNFRMYKVAD